MAGAREVVHTSPKPRRRLVGTAQVTPRHPGVPVVGAKKVVHTPPNPRQRLVETAGRSRLALPLKPGGRRTRGSSHPPKPRRRLVGTAQVTPRHPGVLVVGADGVVHASLSAGRGHGESSSAGQPTSGGIDGTRTSRAHVSRVPG